jgi:hypothetical protein
VSGGRERTLGEHHSLLAASGLRIVSVLAAGGGDSIIEAARKG